MSEQILRGWRHGTKLSHAGSDMLPLGKDVTITIERIEWKEKEMVNGRELPCYVGYLRPNPYTNLPIVINATNLKLLRKISGAEDPILVKDFNVTMTREETKDIQFGGKCWGLRFSKIKAPQSGIVKFGEPKEKAKLTIQSENLQQIKDWLAGDGTIAGVIKKYDVEEKCLEELKKVKEF